MVYYADTSALVKLVVHEQETTALRAWIDHIGPELVACDLVRTELLRAVRRVAPGRILLARAVLDALTLTTISSELCEQAGRMSPDVVRSLDALHLAAALELGDELAGLLTYDDRLAEAANANGIVVFAPR